MKKAILFILALGTYTFIQSCGDSQKSAAPDQTASESVASEVAEAAEDLPSTEEYDPKRGEGKFNAENLVLAGIDESMATKGEAISGTKCTSCHKLTDERLVGPGWKGVTSRREPYWIMNFITNPDPMIDKDPEVQAQLEICLVRMPNQSLTEEDARHILEFMRKNDGLK